MPSSVQPARSGQAPGKPMATPCSVLPMKFAWKPPWEGTVILLFPDSSGGSWNAVYGQPDAEGNPIPVWDQQTGTINPAVVDAWRPWDLDVYVRENWTGIGSDLAGKLHFLMGDMDDYYLTNGLRILEETLNVMEAPAADAQFTWLPYRGHCGFGTQIHYIDVLEDITLRAAGGG